MAIKGKSRSRGARGVARGPKPVYVPVKRPLVQRRGFRIGLALVVGLAVAGGLVYGFVKQRNQDHARAEERTKATAMRRYSGELDPILQTVGQVVPPGSTFKAFPELASSLGGLADGSVDPATARRAAGGVVSTARSAAPGGDGIDAVGMVGGKGFTAEFVSFVLDSKAGITSALRLYEQVAELTLDAVRAPDPLRADLVDRGRALLKIADDTMARGYDAYVQAQGEAGTFQPTFAAPSGATGFPGVATGATAPVGTGTTGNGTGGTP
jgi:hypothetical protein